MPPSESDILTVYALTRSEPSPRPMLCPIIASALPLLAQSRSMHPMQTSQAENHQMNEHHSQGRVFV